jgi:hypothetical protein
MLRKSKKTLCDNDGKPIKALVLYKFFATVLNLDGSKDGELTDVPLDGYLLGNSAEANSEAHNQTERLEKQYPQRKVTVIPHSMELVGPLVQQQMKGLMENAQFQNLVLFVLARDLAEYKAKEKLDLNVDKDALAQELVIEAYNLARAKVNKFKADQEAKEATGLVGPDHQPIASTPKENLGSKPNWMADDEALRLGYTIQSAAETEVLGILEGGCVLEDAEDEGEDAAPAAELAIEECEQIPGGSNVIPFPGQDFAAQSAEL